MRELLTIVAAFVIVVLTAALAVPPLVDWRAHRGLVDGALARAVGTEVASDGDLHVRLLPSPSLRMERLRIGPAGPTEASLQASSIEADIALTPLLAGEIKVVEARLGRAELRWPAGPGGAWSVPRRLLSDAALRRAFALDDLRIGQLLVTVTDPATGRTDQAFAETVRASAGSLAGPWRLEGASRGLPFEIALGELEPDLKAALKAGAGGGATPRLDLDARLEFAPAGDDALEPRLAGTARFALAGRRPPDAASPLPFAVQTTFRVARGVAELEGLTVEAGEGAAALRLGGGGRLSFDEPRLRLSLSGRRLDLASFVVAAGGWSVPRLAPLRDWTTLPIDVSATVESVAIGGDDDLTAVEARVSTGPERVKVDRLDFTAPGRTRIGATGEIGFAAGPSGQGSVSVQSRDSDRLARFLAGLGFDGLAGLLDGRPLDAAADLTAADPVLSLRNLRATLGEASLSGALRYTRAEAGGRPRLDAQLALQNLDLARMPDGGPLFDAARRLDFGLTLDARNVGYGAARGGRITARFATDGAAVLIDHMEVADLAGAQATLSGRLAPDGTGRIDGRLQARRAAPLVDLFGRAWMGGAVRLLPEIVREGPLDLTVRAERAALGGAAAGLRSTLTGTAGAGPVTATTVSSQGVLRELSATVSTDSAGAWLGYPAVPGLARPGRLDIAARREGARLSGSVRGDLAGLAVRTMRPLVLGPEDDRLESGQVELASSDLAAFSALLGEGAIVRGALPGALRLDLSGEPARFGVVGTLGPVSVTADLTGPSRTELSGAVTLSQLSLPWLASALALNAPGPAPPGAAWPTARFGRPPDPPVGGTVQVRAGSLLLAQGVSGRDARFDLSTSPDGFSVADLRMAIGQGEVRGGFSLARQGGLASLIGETQLASLTLGDVIGAPLAAGRLSWSLRFGSSGESVAGLLSNLGGAGAIELAGLRIEGADPGAPERAASRALRGDDPLAAARLTALLNEELGRGPLAAAEASASASLVGGSLRISPLRLASPGGVWDGSASIDLRNGMLDARGSLSAAASPRRWSGSPPAVTLGWAGPLSRPSRTLETGPLINGLASVVLQRELERIEVFELDAAERGRLNARVEMDRKRRADAEEAERQRRLREEAAERARLEAERARAENERARLEVERFFRGAAEFAPRPPADIRPPAQSGAPGG